MRIRKRSLFLVVLILFLAIFLVNPVTFATRVYAWFNYMGDNIKEIVDLATRYSILRIGPDSYRLVYDVLDYETTIAGDLNLRFAEVGAQFMGEYYIRGAAHKKGIERIGWAVFLYAILLPIGAVRILRGRRLNYLNATNFRNVPDDKFEIWRKYATKSINSFFWAAWGTFIISIVIGIIAAPFLIQPGSPRIFLFVLFLFILIWLFLGLIDWLRYRIKAVELQKRNKRKFSGLAIVGLICSFVGLFHWIIPTVIGFTLGFVSLGIIKHSHGEIRGKGIAMAALVICILNTIWSIFLVMTALYSIG